LFGHPGIDRYLQSTSTMSLESVRIVTFWVSRATNFILNTIKHSFFPPI
jgi:hypothetical protein